MDRALSLGRNGPAALIPVILAALPAAMVLHDGLLRTNPNDALWSMPLPVALVLVALIGSVWQAGAFRASAPPDPAGRLLLRAALALWTLAMLLAGLRAGVPLYGVLRLAEVALAAGVSLALAAAIRAEGAGFARTLALAFVAGVAAALPLVAMARLAGWPAGYGPLDLPGFTHIRIMGFSLALALAAAAGLWGGEAARSRALLFTAMVAMATALFWSGGRGGLAALLLPMPLLALAVPALRAGMLPLLGALALGAGAAWFLPGDGAEFGIAGRIAEAASGAGTSAEALTSGRTAMWRTLWQAMAEAPLLGHGAAQSHWIFAAAGHGVPHVHAHNLVLDAALALGWPGAAAAGVLTLAALWRWLRRARASASPLHAAGLAMTAVFLAFAMVDGIYVYWQGLLPLALGAALFSAPPARAPGAGDV